MPIFLSQLLRQKVPLYRLRPEPPQLHYSHPIPLRFCLSPNISFQYYKLPKTVVVKNFARLPSTSDQPSAVFHLTFAKMNLLPSTCTIIFINLYISCTTFPRYSTAGRKRDPLISAN